MSSISPSFYSSLQCRASNFAKKAQAILTEEQDLRCNPVKGQPQGFLSSEMLITPLQPDTQGVPSSGNMDWLLEYLKGHWKVLELLYLWFDQ